MTDTRYNGWRNYETWNCALWIDNEQGSQEYWQERARECLQAALDDEESEPKNAAAVALSQELDSWLEENRPELPNGFFADILGAAINEVDTREIAEHWLADIDLWSAGWNMPGYMPDNPPAVFMDDKMARSYIADAMEDAATNSEHEALVEECVKGSGEYGETIGAYHYFVTKL